MIIIEGMDNSGKTTLAKTLSSHFNYPLIHSCGYCPNMLSWARTSLSTQRHKIYDRHPCISEKVYGPVLRADNKFDSLEGVEILRRLIERRPLIIYCKPPDFVIRKNMGEQMDGVIDNVFALMLSYNRVMDFFRYVGLLIIKYDYTEQSEIGWENLISIIKEKELHG